MAHPLLNGAIGGDGFQTTEVAAIAALAQRVNLYMAYFTDIAIAAEENLAIHQYPGTGAPVQTNQNGVITVMSCTKVVLGQRQTANIVADKSSEMESFL